MIGLHKELEELEQQGCPVLVGMIGCGQMGVDVVSTTHMMRGLRIVAVADIDIERAKAAYETSLIEGRICAGEYSRRGRPGGF